MVVASLRPRSSSLSHKSNLSTASTVVGVWSQQYHDIAGQCLGDAAQQAALSSVGLEPRHFALLQAAFARHHAGVHVDECRTKRAIMASGQRSCGDWNALIACEYNVYAHSTYLWDAAKKQGVYRFVVPPNNQQLLFWVETMKSAYWNQAQRDKWRSELLSRLDAQEQRERDYSDQRSLARHQSLRKRLRVLVAPGYEWPLIGNHLDIPVDEMLNRERQSRVRHLGITSSDFRQLLELFDGYVRAAKEEKGDEWSNDDNVRREAIRACGDRACKQFNGHWLHVWYLFVVVRFVWDAKTDSGVFRLQFPSHRSEALLWAERVKVRHYGQTAQECWYRSLQSVGYCL